MSSVVYYKFINEKEPSRISFDGTGISVFELKRDIIKAAQLGDGTDFDLVLYHQGTRDEYTDDTTIVPRSSLVEAKRVRASRPGQGRAARYVSGKMPTVAKNAYRLESTAGARQASTTTTTTAPVLAFDESQTEEERIAAMMKAGNTQWEQEKQKMANQTPVFFGRPAQKPATTPAPDNDKPPPPGYLCHRCLQKGHYIQSCPTNGDPAFDQRRRVKRITGIPRSLMQTVDEDEVDEDEGDGDDKKTSTIMVNVDGKRVRAVPDQASWAQYTAKNEATAAKKDEASEGSEELRERGLECPIDKRMFNNPMKTPCCGKTYCFDCIESALLDADLVCPGCQTEGVLLDNLEEDAETNAKIRAFENEKKQQAQAKAEPAKPEEKTEPVAEDNPDATAPEDKPASPTDDPATSAAVNPKKRAAEDEVPEGAAPVKMQRTGSQTSQASHTSQKSQSSRPKSSNSTEEDKKAPPPNAPTGPAADRNKANLMNMPMNNMGMGMMNPMMNPMMMGGFMGFPNQFGMNMNFPQQQMNNWQGQGMNGNWNNNMNGGIPSGPRNQGRGGFKSGGPLGNHPNFNADGPYQRQPVNPQRSQARPRRVRQADYKEL